MKGLWAIVARELEDKRTLLIGALVLGVIPWIAPFLPGLRRFNPDDVRGAFMILLGLSLPPALGLGLGASVVGAEVGGRRLGFYFARPLAAWSIWGGKMLVALLVPSTAAVLIFIPPTLLHSFGGFDPAGAWLGGTPSPLSFPPIVSSLGLSILLGALAHVGAGLYRTRSPWLALDLTLAALVAGGFFFVGRQTLDAGAQEITYRAGAWLAAALVSICLAAGFAQVAHGRSDPRRGHLALAGVLWGGLLLCLGGASAFAAWFLSPEPGDLQGRVVVSLGDGDHVLLSAFGSRGRDFFASWFALDARDGSARRVAAGLSFAAVSPNRRYVALIEGALSPRLVLVSAMAGQPPVVTRAVADRDAWPLCLSDDGALVVLKYAGYAQIVDTASGKSRPGPRLEADACTFDGRTKVVLYRRDLAAGSVDRSLFELASARSAEAVRFAGADRPMALRGDRLLARMGGAAIGQVALFEASSGRLVRSLGRATMGRFPGALLLRDRRAAILDQGDVFDTVVRLFDAEGRELWSTRIGERGRAGLVGETSSGEIVATWWSFDSVTTLYLDGARGDVLRKLEGLAPVGGLPFFGASDPTLDLSRPRIDSGLFVDRTEAIYRVDPATAKRHLLVPGQTSTHQFEMGF